MKALELTLLIAPACIAAPSLAPSVPALPAPVVSVPAVRAFDESPIVFIENDYPRALADARARRLPLFVDAWATWCHTCLSLRSYVFPDPAMRPLAGSFVWLSVDTEREENAPLVSRLGVRVLPTLFVIDPDNEKPVLAWPGSLTAPELVRLLEDSAIAVHGGEGGLAATAALLRGHRASAEGNFEQAVEAYRAALDAAPPDWSGREQAIDGLVTRLADAKQLAACVTIGTEQAPKMQPGTGLADVVRSAIGCAEKLPVGAPERAHLAELAAIGERVALDPLQPILADDRSDLFDYVIGALRDLGRADAVTRLARTWGRFLEQQAAAAPTLRARAVFDAHRLLAYGAAGEPWRALPMLDQSERDFPEDYNSPARLAVAYLGLKRYDDALAAVKRAIGLAYGPRKLRLWSLEADIAEAKGDRPLARAALNAALQFAGTEAMTGGYAKLKESMAQRLAKLH